MRPSYAETSLRQVPFGASGRHHLLKAYRNSLMSVLLNHFDRSKRFQDGMQARSNCLYAMSAGEGIVNVLDILCMYGCRLPGLASHSLAYAAGSDGAAGGHPDPAPCARQPEGRCTTAQASEAATGSGSLALMPRNLGSRQVDQVCGVWRLQDRAQARQQSPQEIELMDRLTELAAARASGDITASMLLPPRAPGQPPILEFEEVGC